MITSVQNDPSQFPIAVQSYVQAAQYTHQMYDAEFKSSLTTELETLKLATNSTVDMPDNEDLLSEQIKKNTLHAQRYLSLKNQLNGCELVCIEQDKTTALTWLLTLNEASLTDLPSTSLKYIKTAQIQLKALLRMQLKKIDKTSDKLPHILTQLTINKLHSAAEKAQHSAQNYLKIQAGLNGHISLDLPPLYALSTLSETQIHSLPQTVQNYINAAQIFLKVALKHELDILKKEASTVLNLKGMNDQQLKEKAQDCYRLAQNYLSCVNKLKTNPY